MWSRQLLRRTGLSRAQRVTLTLEQSGEAWAQGVESVVGLLNRALREGDVEGVAHYRRQLEQLVAEAEAVEKLRSQVGGRLVGSGGSPAAAPSQPSTRVAAPKGGTDVYCISSSTLAEAYHYLTQRSPTSGAEPEWMLAVTGIHREGLRTLEQLVEVKLARQSAGQAAFDMAHFTAVAVTLHEHGQALHAVFHSHRFAGPPQPSSIDYRLQRLLEEGGYPAIQAVFSEDGYVRFFSDKRPFTIEVIGKGAEQHDCGSRTYRIVEHGTLPRPTEVGGRAARGAMGPIQTSRRG